jgi:poly(3-hydroxybutyrate) depolymerase
MRNNYRHTVHLLMLGLWVAAVGPAPVRAQALHSYTVASSHIYVAGISSGATMAMQLHVAYSHVFKGAALYAGQPYSCAQGSSVINLSTCSQNIPPVDVETLEKTTTAYAAQGQIDSPSNLEDQPVYLWSGRLDTVVVQGVTNAVEAYYKHFGANVFHYDNQFPAAHGWESPYGPLACGLLFTPFLIHCELHHSPYDSEAVWLSKWFGSLTPKNSGPLQGSMYVFDQNGYAPGGVAAQVGMDRYGYLFVPQSCATGAACGLIVALHGCLQDVGHIGLQFIMNAGLNQWADTNNIIIVYPQTASLITNPTAGCWDIWGYLPEEGQQYATKSGPQMQTLFNIVKQVGGGAIP